MFYIYLDENGIPDVYTKEDNNAILLYSTPDLKDAKIEKANLINYLSDLTGKGLDQL